MSSPATTPFNAGPGPDGLRVVWPFGIRACGRCIESNTLKVGQTDSRLSFTLPLIILQDVQILVSGAASLRIGLPYIFLTPDLHFIPEVQRQLPGGIPSHLRVAKVYFNEDTNTIIRGFESAKGFGDGAAEEWRKGLYTKGKAAMADAARWEKWEGQMRLGSDLSQVLREYDLSSFPHHLQEMQSRSAGSNGAQPAMVMNGEQASQHFNLHLSAALFPITPRISICGPSTRHRIRFTSYIACFLPGVNPNMSCRCSHPTADGPHSPEWIWGTTSDLELATPVHTEAHQESQRGRRSTPGSQSRH